MQDMLAVHVAYFEASVVLIKKGPYTASQGCLSLLVHDVAFW